MKDATETLYKYLRDPMFAVAYLRVVLKTNDTAEILLAVKDIAKAQE